MTSANAVRFLAYEAARCHRLTLDGDAAAADAHQMLCLLFPALLEALELKAMEDYEVRSFRFEFQQTLKRRRELVAMRRELGTLEAPAASALATQGI